MKKTLLLILLFALSLSCIASAASLKKESSLDESAIKKIIGSKFFTMDSFSLSSDTGSIFFLYRDEKTRKMEWGYLDPFSKRLLKRGDCPFKAFVNCAVSPDGKSAVVFANYPYSLWLLDIEKSKWTTIYTNPGKKGLALIAISPLAFVESDRIFSILDLRDAEGFVTNSFVTIFSLIAPGTAEKLVSLSDLQSLAVKTVFKTAPPKWDYKVDFLRYGEEKTIAFIFRTRTKDKKQYRDYLFTFNPPDKIALQDQGDKIFPLDYSSKPPGLLYTSVSHNKAEIIYSENGRKTTLMNSSGIVGRILKNGEIALGVVEGKAMSIYMGSPTGKMENLLKVTEPYSVGFIGDGKKVVLMSKEKILCYSLSK